MYNLKHIPHIIYFLLIPKYKLCYVCIGTETNPFRHDDEDKYIIHDMIQQGTQSEGFLQEDAPKDDGSQYLNNFGDGDADHPEVTAMHEFHIPQLQRLPQPFLLDDQHRHHRYHSDISRLLEQKAKT